MKTLGLIGGISWEMTATYYQLLNRLVRERVGGLASAELVLYSLDFAPVSAIQVAGDWAAGTALMEDAARAVVRAGAEAIVICSNAMHHMAREVEEAAGVPVIHIADAIGAEVRETGCHKPLLLATRYTTEQATYLSRLTDSYGLDVRVPSETEQAMVHEVIIDELSKGIVKEPSRALFVDIAARAFTQGADCVIFGRPEIALLLSRGNLPLPAFDVMAVHAAAAVEYAFSGTLIAEPVEVSPPRTAQAM